MKLMFLLIILLLIVYMPDVSSLAARNALAIWGLDVIPSLFPYMVLCKLIANQFYKQKKLPALPVIAALGILGGSPSGAAALSSYAQQGCCSRRQLYSLCALTGTISPMFFLSTMRNWNIAPSLSRWLFCSHFGGALLTSLCVYFFLPAAKSVSSTSYIPSDSASSPIVQSVSSVLNVGGCIVFFSVIAACFSASLAWLSDTTRAVFHGLLEIAGGVHALSSLRVPVQTQGLLIAMTTGFSGFSILSQNALFLKDNGIIFSQLVILAILRSIFSVCLMALILKFF